MLIVAIQFMRCEASKEFYVIVAMCDIFKCIGVFAISRDQKIGIRIIAEDWDNIVQALDFFQTTDEQEIGARIG